MITHEQASFVAEGLADTWGWQPWWRGVAVVADPEEGWYVSVRFGPEAGKLPQIEDRIQDVLIKWEGRGFASMWETKNWDYVEESGSLGLLIEQVLSEFQNADLSVQLREVMRRGQGHYDPDVVTQLLTAKVPKA